MVHKSALYWCLWFAGVMTECKATPVLKPPNLGNRGWSRNTEEMGIRKVEYMCCPIQQCTMERQKRKSSALAGKCRGFSWPGHARVLLLVWTQLDCWPDPCWNTAKFVQFLLIWNLGIFTAKHCILIQIQKTRSYLWQNSNWTCVSKVD